MPNHGQFFVSVICFLLIASFGSSLPSGESRANQLSKADIEEAWVVSLLEQAAHNPKKIIVEGIQSNAGYTMPAAEIPEAPAKIPQVLARYTESMKKYTDAHQYHFRYKSDGRLYDIYCALNGSIDAPDYGIYCHALHAK